MISPPVLVVDDDVEIYASLGDAERSLEPSDIRRGMTRIFDGQGRLIRANIVRRHLAEVVRFEMDSDVYSIDEFRRGLIRLLQGREDTSAATASECSMEDLVQHAMKYVTK